MEQSLGGVRQANGGREERRRGTGQSLYMVGEGWGMEGRNPGPAGIRDCMQYQEGTGELLCWVRSKQAEQG